MYNLSDISTKFFSDKLITFRSSLNSTTSVLDSDLTGVSMSNRYFNTGVNPYVTIENIEAFLPLLSGYTIAAYDGGTTYGNYNTTFSLDNAVLEDSKIYISVAAANVGNLVTETDYWKETTLLSLILKDKIRTSIEVVLSNLLVPNNIKDNVYMYRIADKTDDVIENTSKLVGYRINPISSDHLLFIINQIGLDFEGTESIELSLYNQNTLVSTLTVNSTANYFTWEDITQIDITSNSGAWYLFYDQDTLTDRAIGLNTVFDTCMNQYANITPFEIDSTADLVDFDESNLVYDRNYGLNLNFSISYDLTRFVKQHLRQLAECIQTQFEYDILEMFASNPNAQSELKQRNIKINAEILRYELKSFEGYTVANKLRTAYKRIEATLSKLGSKDSAFVENEEDNFSIGSV